MSRILSREELAWASGFFDGEGTATRRFHRQREGLPYPVLMVSQSTTAVSDMSVPLVLTRFKEAVGGLGHICGPYPPRTARCKPQAYWTASSFEHAQAVAAFLWGYLSPIKRQQIKHVIREYLSARAQRIA